MSDFTHDLSDSVRIAGHLALWTATGLMVLNVVLLVLSVPKNMLRIRKYKDSYQRRQAAMMHKAEVCRGVESCGSVGLRNCGFTMPFCFWRAGRIESLGCI